MDGVYRIPVRVANCGASFVDRPSADITAPDAQASKQDVNHTIH